MVNNKKYTEEELKEHRRLYAKEYYKKFKEEHREKCRNDYRTKYYKYNIQERIKTFNEKFTLIFTRIYSYYDNIDTKRGYTKGRSIKQDCKLLINIFNKLNKLNHPLTDVTINYNNVKILFFDVTPEKINNFKNSFYICKIL